MANTTRQNTASPSPWFKPASTRRAFRKRSGSFDAAPWGDSVGCSSQDAQRSLSARSRRWSAVAPSIVPLLLVLAAGCSGSQAQEPNSPPPAPEVGVVAVQVETVALTSELAGRTAAYQTSEVRPQISGLVEARLFTEGALVRAGQPLYRIDASLYQAAVAEAQANVASASAVEAGARIRAERLRPLAEAEAVSQQDFTDAQANANSASAAVAQRRAALDTARINLRFTRVTAPITGRIGRSMVTTGALVTTAQATPLATIQRLDPMFVDIQQSSADLLRLRQSLASGGAAPTRVQVRLTLENGQAYPFPGVLEFTEATVDPDTGSVNLRASFPNPDGLLLPGMFVRAALAQSVDQDAILVPQQAILREPTGEAAAMVVGPNNQTVRRAVQVGRAVGNRWLVTGGLRPGEQIIVEGLANARPGQTVRPVPAGSRQRFSTAGAAS